MITEDYVSFETAKLLREKGFAENTPVNYFVGDDKPRGCMVGERIYHKRLEEDTHLIACPTLQMAMKWLRKTHWIDIEVRSYYLNYLKPNDTRYYTGKILKGSEDVIHTIYAKDTYEEVCEAAIKYGLENLI